MHINLDSCLLNEKFPTEKIGQAELKLVTAVRSESIDSGMDKAPIAVAYLRLVDVFDRIHCSFVMGKARLAPIHEITIPRLELTAAVISVKLGEIIREELEIEIDQVNYWTDSIPQC